MMLAQQFNAVIGCVDQLEGSWIMLLARADALPQFAASAHDRSWHDSEALGSANRFR